MIYTVGYAGHLKGDSVKQNPELTTHRFIENCVWRILRVPCNPAQETRRAKDLARAVKIAAENGLESAHRSLLNTLRKAEAGGYNQ